MNNLNWLPLEERRAHNKLKIFFKAKHNLIEIPFDHLMINKNSTRKGGRTYKLEHSNVNSHLYSFYPNSVRLWNSLPDSAKECSTVETFKNALDNLTVRSTYSCKPRA